MNQHLAFSSITHTYSEFLVIQLQ